GARARRGAARAPRPRRASRRARVVRAESARSRPPDPAAGEGLALRGVCKRYGARAVLTDGSFALRPGQVRALIGGNGAGKSTVVRVACGLLAPDAGQVAVDGAPLAPGDPRAASARGIGAVHQHFMLVDTMTVAQNVALGCEPRKGPLGLVLDRE